MTARVTVYVPIYKVRADYIVKQGRTWSAFEHMVLWKLAQERATSVELAELSGVPLRLVVECLIELIGVGWVDIHASSGRVAFEATASGKKAAALKKLPEDTRNLRRRDTLCMERITMSFFQPEDLTLIHKDKLPENAFVLRPRVFKLTMSPTGSVDRLYMKEDETFEEWVDHRITAQRLFASVQISGDQVEGLPQYTSPEFRQAIVEAVIVAPNAGDDAAADEVIARAETRLETEDGYSYAEVTTDDLIVGGPAHLSELKRVLSDAKSFVVVHTCFVGTEAVRRLLPDLEAAAKRKVRVDLLWGQRNEELNEEALKDFRAAKAMFDKLSPHTKSYLRFAETDTGSHAKIVLADSGPHGSYEAYVGSCNWLSSLYKSVEVSIRLREPHVVATLASALAFLRIPSSTKWTKDVYRLAELRNECRRANARSDGPHRVAVLRDHEHLAAVREARDGANASIVAVCDLLGPAGETSVFVPMRATDRNQVAVTLIHNKLAKSVSQEERDRAAAALAEVGIKLFAVDQVHGKFMTWDDDALLITSFNWLATTSNPWKPRGAEIGVIVKGPGLVGHLKNKFSEIAGIGSDILGCQA
ncbi:phospholipase D-like domain-containing protein [Bradyrhizobium mercantei]|uniref:phospholipase D-like domain-containing protein n=1 Tax=Bradyrhizobium mercantei TaxID=1904807 RepID=UPI000977FCEE|nr:phospholipase D-like domain-containing protein [Bradyrhizobium mercantei]